MKTVGSLFTGIGGLDLGLERAGLRVIWQCESDPFARRVLAKHWPGIFCYEDVRLIDERVERPDVVAGGFPCQDISNNGRRAGIAGERSGLWSEFARIIRILRPDFALVENVGALSVRGLGRVLGDLAEVGFDAEWSTLSACALGAPHTRERLFIVAYPGSGEGVNGQRPRLQHPKGRDQERRFREVRLQPEPCRVAHGTPHLVDRLRTIGNAVYPDAAEYIGRMIMEASS